MIIKQLMIADYNLRN